MNDREEYILNDLVNIYVSEDEFASDELRRGKELHKKDGVWWIKKAAFYYGTLNKMRICTPNEVSPDFFKALFGYSIRTNEKSASGYDLVYNILQDDNLRTYDIMRLPPKKRNKVRQGLTNCRLEVIKDVSPYLTEMKNININQALRFDSSGEKKDYLPAQYYQEHEGKWKEEMINLYMHSGHFMIGAFVGDNLAAFIDLIIIDDTWEFGAVKSHDDYLPQRPVDALYYQVLHTASRNLRCKYVLNGGAIDERESLTEFKMQFLLQPTSVHHYTSSIIPGFLQSLVKGIIK
jgi:hypothetical protein